MVRTNKDITTQNHIKLSILLLQNGLSFCTKNILDQTIENEGFLNINDDYNFHPKFQTFDTIQLAIVNNLNTFVPKSLFDNNQLETYLKFNTKILKNDILCYDEISNFDIVNVYVESVLPNVINEKIEINQKTHFTTTLVTKLLEQNKNNPLLQFFVHFIEDNFQIIILENGKLMFYNSFNYTSGIDVLYYILFVAEQFHLNPEDFSLILLGKISNQSEIYKLIYQYIRNVSFYNIKNDLAFENFVLHQL